jgi:epoxyqueuosine reductase
MKVSSVFNNEFLETLGVLDWGYTEDPIPVSLSHYENWVNDSKHSPLHYLSDHRKHLRRDLRNVYPEFQSALVFLFSYQETKKWMIENSRHEVAAYSLGFEGEDYHFALKNRLQLIYEQLKIKDLQVFYSLDAQPILERDLAHRAGLGWFGKNSMLINQKEGSYFIIGSLLLNQKLEIEIGQMDIDHCGHCTACADACPTKAINLETRTLEASKCISTFTIEVFKEITPPEGYDNSRGEIFGCDICQDVCPWNRKPLSRVESALNLKDKYLFLKDWIYSWPKEGLKKFIHAETKRGFKKILFGTAFDRPGRDGWLKNLKFISNPADPLKTRTDEESLPRVHDEEDA